MHLCAELIAASMMLEPLGEVGANFSLQLSSRTQFTKIKNKKVIAENQCEKHIKSSLTFLTNINNKLKVNNGNLDPEVSDLGLRCLIKSLLMLCSRQKRQMPSV